MRIKGLIAFLLLGSKGGRPHITGFLPALSWETALAQMLSDRRADTISTLALPNRFNAAAVSKKGLATGLSVTGSSDPRGGMKLSSRESRKKLGPVMARKRGL